MLLHCKTNFLVVMTKNNPINRGVFLSSKPHIEEGSHRTARRKQNLKREMTISRMILVLLAATVAFTSADRNREPNCSEVRPGRYCNRDLSGFKICGEHGEMGSSSCSAHYMCPCGFNNRCEDHTSCVQRPKFKPKQIPASFSGSFTGRRSFSFPTSSKEEYINGIQCQDATAGDEKYSSLVSFTDAKNISKLIRREVRIIRKDDSGNFVEVRRLILLFLMSEIFENRSIRDLFTIRGNSFSRIEKFCEN